MSSSLHEAAKEALKTHDALRETHNSEPELGEDGLPIDSDAWMIWHKDIRQPAHDRWSVAMDILEGELGEPAMSRHPFNFRPLCEEILG